MKGNSFSDIVILAGGIGERLWPASRPDNPKQFMKLNDGTSFLQASIIRGLSLNPLGKILIITRADILKQTCDQCAELKSILSEDEWKKLEQDLCIVAEPVARHTTAPILLACRYIRATGRNDGTVLVLASDHVISPIESFVSDCQKAAELADLHGMFVGEKEALELVKRGVNPLVFTGLNLSITSDESKAINFDNEPKVIISASGMCEAGRIRHHLKHNLWREECTILFVGYQAVGTLGRSIVEGAKEVHLFGETIEIRAKIMKLEGVSGHADKAGLTRWMLGFKNDPKMVFIVHGDDSVTDVFAEYLHDEHGFNTYAPFSGTRYDFIKDEFEEEAVGIRIEGARKKTRTVSSVFERLLAAGQRLMAVISHNEGGANKDLAKFADQINSLCDKWDR